MELEELFPKGWVYDIETFANLFTVVFRKLGTKTYEKFVIHESRDDSKDLIQFMYDHKPVLIGFNNLAFDAQILEHIYREDGKLTAEQIYEFGQSVIDRLNVNRFDLPYRERQLSLRQVDLFKMNHYDNNARRTSLKWLEFTTRWEKMADLPYHHADIVTKSNVSKVLSYNRNDVDVTHHFFYQCKEMIELRMELVKRYKKWGIINMSDSSIGSFVFKTMLKNEVDPKVLRKKTKRSKIIVKDCILPFINFTDPGFKEMLENYKDIVINYKETGLKGVIESTVEYDDMEFSFGLGGIHAAYKPGVYEADNDHVIVSIDVTSYYPWVVISNGFYPKHIGPKYCDVYRQVYDMRTKYKKGTAMNYALKIVLNSVYGKSNNEYSYLYDPMLTLQITINGQLMLAMLAERLGRYGRLLLVNTDGIEIKIPKDKIKQVREECEIWEATFGLMLEEEEYKKIVIRDVNSYIAIYKDGKVKRKGFFSEYSDITGEGGGAHSYHKNPSAAIIPHALSEYYVNGKMIEETIYEHNNIHDFLYAIKSRKGFDFWFIKAADDGVVTIDKIPDRVIRYYISKNGFNIYKHFHDNRKANPQAVNKGQLVTVASVIKDERINGEIASGKYKGEPITQFNDINYQHYINECNKTINELENA